MRSLLVRDAPKPVVWIQGGSTRQDSVLRGLAGLPAGAEHVLIHDGARCLVEPALLDRCAERVEAGVALIAATPVTDTIKRVDSEGLHQGDAGSIRTLGCSDAPGLPGSAASAGP